METIVLEPELQEMLEEDAASQSRTASEIVNQVLQDYLLKQQRAKLDREISAYETQHRELAKSLLGKWIAFHNQKLVDSDTDHLALYRRIRKKYGRTPVLIRQVTPTSSPEIWIRTPSTGKL